MRCRGGAAEVIDKVHRTKEDTVRENQRQNRQKALTTIGAI